MLNEPLLTVLDGKAGVHKAVENTLRGSLIQRCQAAFTARSYPEGLSPARAILVLHGDYPARHLRSQRVVAPVRALPLCRICAISPFR